MLLTLCLMSNKNNFKLSIWLLGKNDFESVRRLLKTLSFGSVNACNLIVQCNYCFHDICQTKKNT